MNFLAKALIILTSTAMLLSTAAVASDQQTIVVIRHAEKPAKGLGQLTCTGLQRALRLPGWLEANFARPDVIYAPDPSVQTTEIHGDGQRYDYVRPLITIAPTAIRLGMPINTQLPFNDPGRLADELLMSKYRNSTIYVAWEHLQIMNLAEVMVRRFGTDATVPDWPNSDYDTVFTFHIDWKEQPTLRFEVSRQDLGSLPDTCPAPG